MKVSIARDGAEIGEFPREKLEGLARQGRVQPEDLYWHEGLAEWSALEKLLGREAWNPPVAAAKPAPVRIPTAEKASSLSSPISTTSASGHRSMAVAAIALLLIAVVAIAIWLVKWKNGNQGAGPPLFAQGSSASSTPVPKEETVNKAIADLRQRIDRLPASPAPPLQTFYYDVSANIEKTTSASVPWVALIHGGENVVDPASGKTTEHTDFVIGADYADGEWTFRNYRASRSDLINEVTTEIEENEKTNMPPSVVGMLGLKLNRR